MTLKSPTLNPLITNLGQPRIPAVQGWAAAYDGAHDPLIDLSQAVPGYPPPPEMLSWLGEAAASPDMTGYGNIEGEDSLRAAYAAHVSALFDTSVAPLETHMTSGCNQAFICVAMAVAGAGDTVLMTNPRYFNHESTLAMLGIGTQYVDCDPANGFLPDIDAVRAALTGVKAFAIVSPNNPTGAVYPFALLDAIYEACREAGVWLIVDETYRDFMSSKPHDLFAKTGWQDTLIGLYSFSKSFCIPGHRLGAITAGALVIEAVASVMDNLQICAPRAAQMAIAKAIEPLAEWRAANRAEIDRRADALRETMAEVPEWRIAALGAYFAYVKHPFADRGSEEVAQELAEQVGVSCLPGAFFGEGQDRYLRIAFANADVEVIEDLADRLRVYTYPEPQNRYWTAAAIDMLVKRFNLPPESDHPQGWAFQVGDPEKLDDFVAYFLTLPAGSDEQFTLLDVIVQSFEDLNTQRDGNAGVAIESDPRWRKIIAHVEANFEHHAWQVWYWSDVTIPAKIAWHVAPAFRDIYRRIKFPDADNPLS